MTSWTEVAVRARGLGTHLVSRERLTALAAVRPMSALVSGIADASPELARFLPPDAVDAASVERALRRAATVRLRVLRRWTTGGRRRALAVLLDDEDRRSLRAIVRGALGNVPAEARLVGLVPTPALPERALSTLARQASLGEIASLLRAWGSSYGNAIEPEAERAHPDPYLVQVAIDQEFARRARRASRGHRALRAYVRLRIDAENAVTAVTIAGASLGHEANDSFVAGGRWLGREPFVRAAKCGIPEQSVELLAEALAATPLARQLPDPAQWWSIEDAVLRGLVRHYRAVVRRDPISLADVILYVLRLRAEVRDVARLIWGAALEAPTSRVGGELVSC